MKIRTVILLMCNVVILELGLMAVYVKNHQPQEPEPDLGDIQIPISKIEGNLDPIKTEIKNATPSYMNYSQTVAQLKQWSLEAKELVEIDTYGKSTSGQDLYYLRLNNKRSSVTANKPRVMITACIHGNEPLSSSVVMWNIGNMLKSYNDDLDIRELVDSRDIYFVPVVSPDSYPKSRTVDGVDPNRDFPGPHNPNRKSVAPVAALQDLFMRIRPKAVASCHTWGRVLLIPYGDRVENTPDHTEFVKVVSKMAELSGYRYTRVCDLYRSNGTWDIPPMDQQINYQVQSTPRGRTNPIPLLGTETDWYYRNGAFPVIVELGQHQRIPSDDDTRIEFNKTHSAFLHFIKEAPLVNTHPPAVLNDVKFDMSLNHEID